MDRVISPEERMKRAEEIYYRRKTQGVRVSTASVNIGNTNKVFLGKKMAVQIIISILIYCGFWAMKNYKNVFSDNVINNTKAILNYDVNFWNLYNQGREYFNSHFNNIIKTNNNENENNNEVPSNSEESQSSENGGDNVDINDTKGFEEEKNSNESNNNENNGIRWWSR